MAESGLDGRGAVLDNSVMACPPSPFGRPLDLEGGRIELSHGSGGKSTQQLIEELFGQAFANPLLDKRDDAATVDLSAVAGTGRVVLSTDSFVVSPRRFPGGNIGSLAIHGTVNDIAMAGARPLHLAAAFILEEGLALAELVEIIAAMAAAAREAGVTIVTGDTKVVERGKGDGVFITTTGVGVAPAGVAPSADRARPGDVVLLSGPIGDHGVAILSARDGLSLSASLASDSAALNGLVAEMIAIDPDIHVLRDPTRGGLAAAANEIAHASGVGLHLDEVALPVRPAVAAACEILGLDPLHVANEGKLIAIVAAETADAVLAAMRRHPRGRDAARIGTVIEDPDRFVQMTTRFGGRRMVDWIAGDQLPRIC